MGIDQFGDDFWGADCEACNRPRWHQSDYCSAIHMGGHYWRLGAHSEMLELEARNETQSRTIGRLYAVVEAARAHRLCRLGGGNGEGWTLPEIEAEMDSALANFDSKDA